MAAPPSSYGERPPLQGFRRSFTTPHRRLSYHERAGLDKSDSDAEILFSHSSARIVHFAPPTDSIKDSKALILPDTDYPVDTIETLPWASTTETTLASGLLVIEKVRGSTNFLKSGDVQKPILRNSQCWCVDNVSKFVLRVRKFVYYRVELPTNSAEDTMKVEELKIVLKRILKYEVTPCPFKRGFHVDLPDSALTPRRKGQWKPKEGSLTSSPLAEDESPLQRLRSSSTWSQRAVSDGRLLNQNTSETRADSGYGESPVTGRSSLPVLGVPARSATPSSATSSEQEAESEEHEKESEAIWSDQDDAQEESQEPKGGLESELEEQTKIAPNGRHAEDSTQPLLGEHNLVSCEDTQGDVVNHTTGKSLLDKYRQPDQGEKPPDLGSEPHDEEAEASADLYTPENEQAPEEENAPEGKLVPDRDAIPEAEQETEASELGLDNKSVSILLPESEELQENRTDLVELPLPDDHYNDDVRLQEVETVHRLPLEIEDQSLLKQGQTGDNTAEPPIEPEIVSKVDGQDSDMCSRKQPEDEVSGSGENVPDDTLSMVSSVDSFHTFASSDEFPSGLDVVHMFDNHPTPMAERFDPLANDLRQHKREISELTVTASSPRSAEESFDSPEMIASPSSPILQEGLRNRLSQRRSLSPLPPPTTLFAPPQHQSQGNHLTSAILQKACSLALVKPIEVVILLVHILARIAGGATVNDLMSGDLFKRPEEGRDHRRNSSLPDHIDFRREDGTDEDDFGIPIRGEGGVRRWDSMMRKQIL